GIGDEARKLGAIEPAEQLRQATALRRGRVDEPEDDLVSGLDEAVAHQSGGDERVVVGPDRTAVVADRVVPAHRRGQCAHAPAAAVNSSGPTSSGAMWAALSSSKMPFNKHCPMFEARASMGRLARSSPMANQPRSGNQKSRLKASLSRAARARHACSSAD